MNMNEPSGLTFRSGLAPGDLGRVVELHGRLYAAEFGFDVSFEAYVAGPLAEFVLKAGCRDRIWLAQIDDRLVGCVAIVERTPTDAQLRWFLVSPEARGQGIGQHLMTEARDFARAQGYQRVVLWTVSELTSAARLYERFGFKLIESHPPRPLWGASRVEQMYAMELGPRSSRSRTSSEW